MNRLKDSAKLSFRHKLSPLGFSVYMVIVISSLILIALRRSDLLNQLPLVGDWQIGLHIYNFAISLLFVTAISTLWVLMGVHRWYQLIVPTVAMIIVNVVYEFMLSFLNVRDPLDAIYGIIGSLVGFLGVLLIRRIGIKPVVVQK